MKKENKLLIAVLLAFAMLFGMSLCGSAAEEIRLGEVDGSEGINASDALRVLQHSVHLITLNDAEKQAADVNGDGSINASDALSILQYSVGLIDEFPADWEEGSHTLTVLENQSYEWIGIGRAGIIIAGKDGKYGTIDEQGNTVIDFVYDRMVGPNAEGYICAYQNDDTAINGRKSFLFSPDGEKVWESREQYLHAYTEGVMVIFDGIESLTNEEGWEYDSCSCIYQTLNGEQIARFDDVIGIDRASPFSEGVALINCWKGNYYGAAWDITLYILSRSGEITAVDETYYGGPVHDGLFPYSDEPTPHLQVRSVDGKIDYYVCAYPEDWFYNTPNKDNWYVRIMGTLTIYGKVSEDGQITKYIIDLAKSPASEPLWVKDICISDGYDDIVLNAEEAYFLVSRDNRWGYLSRDGKSERMYADAGYFYGGKAIVLQDNGEIVVIDNSFQPISQPLTGYDVVGTVGENLFRVEKDGQAYLAVYQP